METIVIKKEPDRRLPLQDRWFDYHLDSIVYSFMLVSATARIKPGDKTDGTQSFLYLSQSKYNKIRPMIKTIIGRSARQVNEKRDKLIKEGYIAYDKQKKQYTFPFDYNQNYYIVSVDVLAYLCTVSNPFVIKIYFYLANKFRMKSGYRFTYKELRLMLGYSESQNKRVTDLIKLALSALSVMNFIEYRPIKVNLPGKEYKIDNFQLINVVGRKLPKIIRDELQNNLSLEGRQVTSYILGDTK